VAKYAVARQRQQLSVHVCVCVCVCACVWIDMAKVKWLSRLFDLIYWLSAIVA